MGWTYPELLAVPVDVYDELVTWLTRPPDDADVDDDVDDEDF